ncbi:MAG: hypothetical protein ACOC1I_03960 [Spirochaetota bacterium]
MLHPTTGVFRLFIPVALFLSVALFARADDNEWWRTCAVPDYTGEYEYRHERATDARTQDDLRALYENPTVIRAYTESASEGGAAIETLTETHAVFPIRAESILATLQDDDTLTTFVPNLGDHEVVCRFADNHFRQRQRTDFGFLFLRFSSEYVIDVEYVDYGPGEYGSRWVLVESIDGQIAYNYGSWYFEEIMLDGRRATYVRHYARTGLTSGFPGAQLVVGGRLEGEMRNLFRVFYEETVRRYGRVTLAE